MKERKTKLFDKVRMVYKKDEVSTLGGKSLDRDTRSTYVTTTPNTKGPRKSPISFPTKIRNKTLEV